MQKWKLWIVKAMAVSLAISVFSGCAGSGQPTATSTPDASVATEKQSDEFVKLVLYAIGDQGGPYAQEALDNVNAMLKEKINAELEVTMVSYADYKQKFPVVMASGENFDMMFSANWVLFDSEAPKGAYYPLNDLLPVYAPKTYAQHSEEIWEQCSFDGNIYLFPRIDKEYASNGILIREDLRIKYSLPEIKTYEDLGTYMEGIKQNEPNMTPYNTMAAVNPTELFRHTMDWATEIGGRTSITYKFGEPENLFSYVFTDEYEAYVNRQREWYNKGYWSSSVLSEKNSAQDTFKNGLGAVYIGNVPTCAGLIQDCADKGMEARLYPIDLDSKIERQPYKQNGYAISVNSKNPERSLMFMELVNQDQDVFDALQYGIKGKTYDLTEDGKTIVPEGVNRADITLMRIGMGLGNPNVLRVSATYPAEMTAVLEEYDKKGVSPDLGGFIFIPDNVSAEIAALSNIYTQYQLPLNWGVTDPATGLPELREQMKAAGIDKVIEEVKTQVDAYLAKG